MSDKLTEDIALAIEKSLPKQVGESLKTRLDLCDRLEETLEVKELDITKLKEECNNLTRDRDNLQTKLAAYNDLEVREKALEEEQINLKVTLLTNSLVEAEKRADIIKEYTATLVKNTTFKKSIFGNENGTPYYDNNNNYITPNSNISRDETITED